MSQRGKRGNRLENDSTIIQQPPVKRRKGRPTNTNNYNNGSGGNGNGSNGGSAASNVAQNAFYDGASVDTYNFDKVPSHIGATNVPGTGACPTVSASNFAVPSTSKAQGSGGGGGGSSSSAQWHARAIGDLKSSSIYNRSSSEAPAELFRKDLISAMKLPDSEPLSMDEYWLITDQWKQEWEKGVQVPVNPDSLPEPSVKYIQDYSMIVPQNHDFRPPKNKYVRITKDDSFSPELHYLSNVPTMAESVCAYDLDQTDECWLKIVNRERVLSGVDPILDSQFERVIEELEVRCWDKIQAIMKTEEGLGIEYDENVICDVCRSPDSEEANEMVFCDNCNICVHQACYGITTIPSGQWLCRTCNNGEKPECVLCPNKGGAMKSTKSGKKWAHVSCALWIPEVSIGCVDRMEPITKISSIPQSRWALLCVLCRERVGACIQCSVKTCKTAYHVTCAFQHGLEMRAIIEEGNAEDGVKLRSYCLKHSVGKGKKDNKNHNNGTSGNGSETEDDDCRRSRKVRKDMTTEERNQARAQRLQEVEAEFDKHVNIKDISCHVHDIDQDAISYIYYYWILKRKQNFNRALIPAKSDDVELLSSKQDEEEAEQRRKVVHLRQDLERVRNLCYMVNRREKLSRSYFKTSEQIFYKQTAILSTISNKDSGNTNNNNNNTLSNNINNNHNSINNNQNQSGNNNLNNVNNISNNNNIHNYNNNNNNIVINNNNNNNNSSNNPSNNSNNINNNNNISNNNIVNNSYNNVSSDESFISAVLHANNGPSAYDKFYSSDVNIFGDPPNSQFNLEDILTALVSRIDTSVSSLKNTHSSDKKNGKGNNSISTANAVNSGISNNIGKTNKTALLGISDSNDEFSSPTKGNKRRIGKTPYKQLQLNGMTGRKKRSSALSSNKGETPSAVDCIYSSDSSSSNHSSSSKSDDSDNSSSSTGTSSTNTSSLHSPGKDILSNSSKKTNSVTGTQRPNKISNKNTGNNLANCNKKQTYARTQLQKQQQKRNKKQEVITSNENNENDKQNNLSEISKKRIPTNKPSNKRLTTETTNNTNLKKKLLLEQMLEYSSDSSNESEELLPIKHRTSASVTGADLRNKVVNKKVPIYSYTDSDESASHDDESDDTSQRDSSKGDNDASSGSDASSISDKEKETDNTVSDSQHQMFRTKAAMKEFNLQSAANKLIKTNSVDPKLNKKMNSEKSKSNTSLSNSDLNSSPEVASSIKSISKNSVKSSSTRTNVENEKISSSGKDKLKKSSKDQIKNLAKSSKQTQNFATKIQNSEILTKTNQIPKTAKNFSTDLLVVPQRQAAKKASENMRSNNVYSNTTNAPSAVSSRKDSRDSRFDEKETVLDRVPPLPSPVNSSKVSLKEQTNENNSMKDSKDFKDNNECKKTIEKENKISKERNDVSGSKDKDRNRNRNRNETRERTSKRGRPPKTSKDENVKETTPNNLNENVNLKEHQKDKVSTKIIPKSRPPSPENLKTMSSNNDKENTKENLKDKINNKNVLANDLSNLMAAFVPQRQAAKKAAEHIKSGLSKPVVTTAEFEKDVTEAKDTKDKESNSRLSSSTPIGSITSDKSTKTSNEGNEKHISSNKSVSTSRPITKESRTTRRSTTAAKNETKTEKEIVTTAKKTKQQNSSKSESTSESSSVDSDDSENDSSSTSSASSSSGDDRSTKRRKDTPKEKEIVPSSRNVRKRSTFQPLQSTPPTKMLPQRRKSLFMDDRTPVIDTKVPLSISKSTVVSEKENRNILKDADNNSSQIVKSSRIEDEKRNKTETCKENNLDLANKDLEKQNRDFHDEEKVDIPIENLMISDSKDSSNSKINKLQQKQQNIKTDSHAPEKIEKQIPQISENLISDKNDISRENKSILKEMSTLSKIDKITDDSAKDDKEEIQLEKESVQKQTEYSDNSTVEKKPETNLTENSLLTTLEQKENDVAKISSSIIEVLESSKLKQNEVNNSTSEKRIEEISPSLINDIKSTMSPVIEIPPTPKIPVPTELDPHPSNLTVENMDIEEIDNGKMIINDSIIEMTKKYSAMEKEIEKTKEKNRIAQSLQNSNYENKIDRVKWPATNSEIIEVIDSSESAQSIKSITGTSNKTEDNLKEIPEIDDIEPANNFNSFVRRKSIDREDLFAIDEDNLNFGEDNHNNKKTTFTEEDFMNSTGRSQSIINSSKTEKSQMEKNVFESVLNKNKAQENSFGLSENIFDTDLIELPPPTPSIFNDESVVASLIAPQANKEDSARETMNLVEKLRQQKNKRAAGNKINSTDSQNDGTVLLDSTTANCHINAQKEDNTNISLHNFQLPLEQLHKQVDTHTIVPNRKENLNSTMQQSEFPSDIYNSFTNNNSNNTNQNQAISNNMIINNQIPLAPQFCGGTPDQNSFQKSMEQSPINPSPIGPHTPMGPSPLSTHGAQTPLGPHTPLGPQTPHSQHTPHTPHGPSPHGPHTPMGPSPLGPHTPQTPLNPPSTPSSIICPNQDQQQNMISPNPRVDKHQQQRHQQPLSQRCKNSTDPTNECFDNLSTTNFFKNRDFVDMHHQITKDPNTLRPITNMNNNEKENNRSLADCEYDDSSRMQSPFNLHPQNMWNENNLIQTRRSVSTSPSSISESNDGTEQHKLMNRDMSCNKQQQQQQSVLQSALCNQQNVDNSLTKNRQNFATALQQQTHFDMNQSYQMQAQNRQPPNMNMNGPDIISPYNYQENNQFNDNSVGIYPTHPSQQPPQTQQMNNQMASFASPGNVNNPNMFSQQMAQYTPPNTNQNTPSSMYGTPTSNVGNSTNHLHSKQQQNMLTSPPVHMDSTSPFHLNQQSCAAVNAAANQNNAGSNVYTSSANMVLNAALVSTQTLISQNQQAQQQQNAYVGMPRNMGSLVNHLSQNQMLNSCDQNKTSISPMGPTIGHQSPTKPPSRNNCSTTAGRHFAQNQIKSPQMHRSPGKSPRQMELLNKQSSASANSKQLKQLANQEMERPTERVRKPRGRGTGAGRPRGRGRGRGSNANRLIQIPQQMPHSLVHEFESPLVGSIQNNLAGTVYDLDFDEDFRSNVENTIKSLRDRRRSFDCRNQNPVNNNQDSLKYNNPSFGKQIRNSVTSRLLPELKPQTSNQTSSIDTLTTTSSLHIHPVLPGPVDMRTYNSGFESHNTMSSSQDSYNSSHNLLREFATGTADHPLPEIDEEDEKEFQSALRASTTVKIKPSSPQLHQQHMHEEEEKEKEKEKQKKEKLRREEEEKRLLQQDQQSLSNASTTDNPTPTPMISNSLSVVSSELHISMETTSEEISIDSDTMTVKQSLSDSRNQLKLKIKGPLAHSVSYNSSSVSSSLTQNIQSQSDSFPINQPSVTSSGGGSIRRMRKKELLRQYVYQDMNQEDSIGLPGAADNASSFNLDTSKIETPKQSTDSILSSLIAGKDDEGLKCRKKIPGCGRELRQLEAKNYDLEQRSSERRRSSACSSGSNSDINIKNPSKRRSKSKQVETVVQNMSSGLSNDLGEHNLIEEHDAPLKIKIRNNAIEPATSFPPKKRRFSASNFPVPSFELLKRDSMNFRKQVMASYGDPEDNPQIIQKIKSHKVKSKDKDRDREKKKKRKDKDRDKEKYYQHHIQSQTLEEIEVKQTMPTKLIIKLKRRADDDQLSLGGGTTTDGNESTTFSIRSASPLPSCSSNNSLLGEIKNVTTATPINNVTAGGLGGLSLKLKISKKSDGYVIGDEIYSKNSCNKDYSSYNYSSTNPAKKSKSSTKSSSSKNRSSSTNSSKSSSSSQIINENSNSDAVNNNDNINNNNNNNNNNQTELIDNNKIPVVILTQTPIPASAVAKLHYIKSRSHSRTSTPDSIHSATSLISSGVGATLPFNNGNNNIDDEVNNDIGDGDGNSGYTSHAFNSNYDPRGAINNSVTSTPIDKSFNEQNIDNYSHLEDSNNSTNSMNQPLVISRNSEKTTTILQNNNIAILSVESKIAINSSTSLINNTIHNSNNSSNNLLSNSILGVSNNENILSLNKDCEIR